MWRQLPAELRRALCRSLRRKSAVIDQKVLDVASALCVHGRPEVALALYHGLAGEPMPVYGCGFGAMWALRELMGEQGPDPTAMILV
jgi:hypothetical protein